jgi:hypothetical protein
LLGGDDDDVLLSGDDSAAELELPPFACADFSGFGLLRFFGVTGCCRCSAFTSRDSMGWENTGR